MLEGILEQNRSLANRSDLLRYFLMIGFKFNLTVGKEGVKEIAAEGHFLTPKISQGRGLTQLNINGSDRRVPYMFKNTSKQQESKYTLFTSLSHNLED